MARWSFNVVTMTPGTGVADAITVGTVGFALLVPGGAAQYLKVYELEEQGQTSSAAGSNFMLWSRDVVNISGGTALATPNSIGPLDVNTAALALPAVGFVAAGTSGPQRSSSASLAKLNMSFNPFGGILRWQAAPGCEWGALGTATSVGESSLSNFTGGATGAQSFKALFEVL